MTVLEVIQKSTDFFAKKGIELPRLQIELLLAHTLEMPRMKLYLNFERVLTEAQLEKVRDLVKRRGNREPLQHILGNVSFCGLDLIVNQNVLIPRPETEILAERGWQFLNSILEKANTPTALDFGTGSGCLAILLAVKCAAAEIHAIDISTEAIGVASENARRHAVSERIHFHEGDGFNGAPANRKYDLIVANPPYIPSAEIETLEPEVRDHDPKLALDGGLDGLEFYRRIARDARAFLNSGGRILLEFGEGQGASIQQIFQEQGWTMISIERDYTQRERFLAAGL